MSFIKKIILTVTFPLLRFEDWLRDQIGYESKPKCPSDEESE